MERLLRVSGWTYLLNGCVHVVFGALLINLLDHYGKGYTEGGALVMLQFLGFLVGVLTMPWWNKAFGRRRTLVIAAGAIFVAESAIGFLPPWAALYALAAVAGLGFGLAESSSGTAVLDAAGEKKAAAMGKIEVYFGLGALVMPFAVAFLIARDIWIYSFFALAGAALLLATVWGLLSFRELDRMMERKPEGEHAPPVRFAKSEWPVLGAMLLFFFIYVGLEVCVINFMPSVFTERYHWDASSAAMTVTGFWCTIVLGRVVISIVGKRLRYVPYLYAVSAASAVCIGALAAGIHAWAAFAFVLLLGLMFAGIFAIALILANDLLPGRIERTSSLCIAAGGLGGSAMPVAVGALLENLSAEAAIAALGAACAVLVLLIFAAKHYHPGTERNMDSTPVS